jgi:hypothetical protein
MAEKAIILIPDISGYTEFTNSTEIDHAAHIVTELLELIIDSNDTDFSLAEIEGDAVLFYRKGEPLGRARLVDQCLKMFSNFHQRLKVIERDTVCQCGACQTASNLTLKFIAHFGYIKEIKVARFVKATGMDMIVAHRLLKNNVDSSEYILFSGQCCEAIGSGDDLLEWKKSSHAYDTIGELAFEFADLSGYGAKASPPPPRSRIVIEKGDDQLELQIEAPLRAVYQTLVNVDKRPAWLEGVDTIDREMTSERINMRHNCVFHGMKLVNTAILGEFAERQARYSERVEIPDAQLTLLANYELLALDASTTLLKFDVNWLGAELPVENKQGMLAGQVANFELFKKVCETNPA